MNRRDFLRRGAMAAVAMSVAPAAALSSPSYEVGGIVSGGTFIVGESCGYGAFLPRPTVERIKAQLQNPDYFISPELLDGGRPFTKRKWEFSR